MIPSSARWCGPSTGRSFALFWLAMPRAPSARREATPTAPAPKPLAGSADRLCQREETAMLLTAQQLRQFAEEGFLYLPGCFSEEEVAILRDEAEQIYAANRQEVWREKTGAPRTAFAAHTYCDRRSPGKENGM